MSEEHDILSQQLQAWLDGELDATQEDSLRAALSDSEDLRREMQEHLAIRAAVQSDLAALTPPADATNSVFSALGFVPPTAAGITAAESASHQRTSRFSTGRLLLLLLLLFGAGSGLWLVTRTFTTTAPDGTANASLTKRAETTSMPDAQQATSSSGIAARKADVEASTPGTASDAPGAAAKHEGASRSSGTNLNGDISAGSATAAVSPTQRRNSAARTSRPTEDPIAPHADEAPSAAEPDVKLDREAAPIAAPKAQPAATETVAPVPARDVVQFTGAGAVTPAMREVPVFEPDLRALLAAAHAQRLPLRLEARSLPSHSTPTPTIASQRTTWMSHGAIGAWYDAGAGHAVGLELGQEPFAQHFSGTENGLSVRYEQNPMAVWLGAAWQYHFGSILLDGLTPYAQADIGGVFSLGPLARVSAGLRFTPLDRFTLSAGYEGAMLGYQFQSKWFNTRMLGFTFGLAFQF